MKDVSETKILVVEDDALLRRSVSRFISQRGYNVLEAENGYEALKIFKKENPALVLTDIRMPVMNGLDLLDKLTTESPEIPVIIFSGATEDQDVKDALRMGALDFIAKPIKKVDILIDKIEKALVKAQTLQGTRGLTGKSVSDESVHYEDELKQRKILEKQIAHAKLEWERTADAISEPIALLDKWHFLTRVNKAMARIFDKIPQEIVGTKKFLSTDGFDNPQQAVIDFELLSGGRKLAGKFTDQRLQASYEVKLTPYYDRDDTTVIGCVYIAREVKDR